MTTYFPGILSTGALVPGLAAGTVRNTLGLGGAALLNVGTSAGTVAAGDAASASIATHAGLTSGVHGISAFGATLIDDAAAVDARNTLGLGTADSPTWTNGTFTGYVRSPRIEINGDQNYWALSGGVPTLFVAGVATVTGGTTNLSLLNVGLQLSGSNTEQFSTLQEIQGVELLVSPRYDKVSQRRGTNGQTSEVYSTWTSATSKEGIRIRGKAGAAFEIGPFVGSAGGTLRGLTMGGYVDGSETITPWLTFSNLGSATITNMLAINSITSTSFFPSRAIRWARTQSNMEGGTYVAVGHASGSSAAILASVRQNEITSSVQCFGTLNPSTSLHYVAIFGGETEIARFRRDNLRFGLGTDNPLAKMHVIGDAMFSAAVGLFNVVPPASQPQTPTTLAEVITILQSYGLSA